ncbi:MAG: alpha-ketoglutarate-dependent dioxygenase AlkB [Chitinophagales bacterium]|nr:alpha-ketoglutarate-dependent dioxygenase AlkB [Chitinophagales bacterium]
MNEIFLTTQNLLPFDGEVYYFPHFIAPSLSENYLNLFTQKIKWKHESITLFGKNVLQPRLTAWYGDNNALYSYSGTTMQPNVWTEELLQLKIKIETFFQHPFNSALLNLYRDGTDSVGWHKDNEKELGKNPMIASLSFGMTRQFKLRHQEDKKYIVKLTLEQGSLLLMKGLTQHKWYHCVPKEPKIDNPRINITFRNILV